MSTLDNDNRSPRQNVLRFIEERKSHLSPRSFNPKRRSAKVTPLNDPFSSKENSEILEDSVQHGPLQSFYTRSDNFHSLRDRLRGFSSDRIKVPVTLCLEKLHLPSSEIPCGACSSGRGHQAAIETSSPDGAPHRNRRHIEAFLLDAPCRNASRPSQILCLDLRDVLGRAEAGRAEAGRAEAGRAEAGRAEAGLHHCAAQTRQENLEENENTIEKDGLTWHFKGHAVRSKCCRSHFDFFHGSSPNKTHRTIANKDNNLHSSTMAPTISRFDAARTDFLFENEAKTCSKYTENYEVHMKQCKLDASVSDEKKHARRNKNKTDIKSVKCRDSDATEEVLTAAAEKLRKLILDQTESATCSQCGRNNVQETRTCICNSSRPQSSHTSKKFEKLPENSLKLNDPSGELGSSTECSPTECCSSEQSSTENFIQTALPEENLKTVSGIQEEGFETVSQIQKGFETVSQIQKGFETVSEMQKEDFKTIPGMQNEGFEIVSGVQRKGFSTDAVIQREENFKTVDKIPRESVETNVVMKKEDSEVVVWKQSDSFQTNAMTKIKDIEILAKKQSGNFKTNGVVKKENHFETEAALKKGFEINEEIEREKNFEIVPKNQKRFETCPEMKKEKNYENVAKIQRGFETDADTKKEENFEHLIEKEWESFRVTRLEENSKSELLCSKKMFDSESRFTDKKSQFSDSENRFLGPKFQFLETEMRLTGSKNPIPDSEKRLGSESKFSDLKIQFRDSKTRHSNSKTALPEKETFPAVLHNTNEKNKGRVYTEEIEELRPENTRTRKASFENSECSEGKHGYTLPRLRSRPSSLPINARLKAENSTKFPTLAGKNDTVTPCNAMSPQIQLLPRILSSKVRGNLNC